MAPKNYVLDSTEYEVTLSSSTKELEISISNTKDIGSISISSLDSRTSEGIENNKFVIYTETTPGVKNYYNSTTGLFSTNIDDATTFVSDNLGNVTINNIPLDNYFIKQVESLEEYILNTNQYSVNIDASNKNNNVTIENIKDIGSIEINKIDDRTNLPLDNAEFIIYTIDSGINNYFNIDGTFTTDLNSAYRFKTLDGKISIINLPLDTYHIKEVESPKNYILSTVINDITIDSTTKHNSITISNSKDVGDITIKITDLQSGHLLDGAEFLVYSKTGSVISYFNADGSFTQDKSLATRFTAPNGSITLLSIPFDNYFIQTVTAPLGYILSTEEHSIAISEDFKSETLNVKVEQLPLTPPPTDGNDSTDSNNDNSSDLPYTGDNSNQTLLLIVMIISATGIFLLIKKSKKKSKFGNRYK